MFVLDASVALAWCFRDEATAATDALVLRASREGIVVPAHWFLEVYNVLLIAERRGRIGTAEMASHVQTIELLAATIDGGGDATTRSVALALARAESLTMHDAIYLELAMRLGADLATRDSELIDAAKRNGVRVVP